MFTKKVLAQKDDIDLIAATAVGATENIRDGNEELRKAIQNQVERFTQISLSFTSTALGITPFIIRLKVEVLCVLFFGTMPTAPKQNTRNLYLQADDKRCNLLVR